MEFIPEDKILKFNPDTLEAVRKLYNLDNSKIVQSVDILEEWIKKQAHFRNKEFDRKFLEIKIILCKGSIEKAKAQIDKVCTFKTLLPKYFICDNLRDILSPLSEVVYLCPLPKLTKDHHRVTVTHFKNETISPTIFLTYFKLNFVFGEYFSSRDYNNGFIAIEDLRSANLMEILTKMNPIEFQQFMTILVEGYGARLVNVHLVTPSKLVELFVNTIKKLTPEKLRHRMHVHADIEDLHKVVDKDVLPVDLGGNEMSLKELQDKWLDVLCSKENENELKTALTRNTDESLRQKDIFNEQYMGLPGSFRVLTVD